MPISQASGANSQPSICSKVSFAPSGAVAKPSSWLASATSATITISMAVTLTSSSMPSRVPCAMASMLECGGSSMTMSAAGVRIAGRRRGVRHHQLRQHQPRRHADDGGDDQVSRRARQQRLQHGGVERQHRAGHAGHADRHGGEQAAAAHGGEIGPHQQRRLHHADEHVGCRRRADRAGDAERALQHPADGVRRSSAARPSDRAAWTAR